MDLTVAAVPVYFTTMGAEYLYLRKRADRQGERPSDYERNDTIASLTMGLGSLLAPLVMPRLLAPVAPGRGRWRRALVATAVGAAAVTTLADVAARRDAKGHLGPAGLVPSEEEELAVRNRRARRLAGRAHRPGRDDLGDGEGNGEGNGEGARPGMARRIASRAGVAAVVGGGVAVCTAWAGRTTGTKLWKHRVGRDLGTGPLALGAAIAGWDFIYYWNHRLMHESRFMWAIHVVHHSSQRYNLSTALRQPVADSFGLSVPYGLLALAGIRPEVVGTARGVNLLYQYWIHTDAIGKLGPFEKVFNTASHHRVHHGVNRQYLDRNHGSILIIWDRLFGTFEPEEEPVVYGLTKNVDSFNPARIATHEHADMLRDVAGATSWRDRLSFVARGPGWAYRRHAERDEPATLVAV